MADQVTEPFCYWSGTAPACAGSCNTGEFVGSTSKFGDGMNLIIDCMHTTNPLLTKWIIAGKTCVTGVKKYCCKMPPQWLAQLAQMSFYVLNGGPIDPNPY